jgi:hypothetical protein
MTTDFYEDYDKVQDRLIRTQDELERVKAELREWQTSIATERLQARLDKALAALREITELPEGEALRAYGIARAAIAEIKAIK